MLNQKSCCRLLIAGAMALSPALARAQSSGAPPQAAAQDSQPTATAHAKNDAIVGSWLGTLSDGNRVVISFTADGISLGSVTTEVSGDPQIPSMTAPQGVWTHLGGRRFGITATGLLYDVPAAGLGTYQGRLQIRSVVTINRAGDHLTGTDLVEIYSPDEQLLESFPGTVEYRRMKAGPFE